MLCKWVDMDGWMCVCVFVVCTRCTVFRSYLALLLLSCIRRKLVFSFFFAFLCLVFVLAVVVFQLLKPLYSVTFLSIWKKKEISFGSFYSALLKLKPLYISWKVSFFLSNSWCWSPYEMPNHFLVTKLQILEP